MRNSFIRRSWLQRQVDMLKHAWVHDPPFIVFLSATSSVLVILILIMLFVPTANERADKINRIAEQARKDNAVSYYQSFK